jgi:3-isopropylmalate dehydrogenase
MAKQELLIVAGDGIGPEVMGEVEKIISFLNENNLTQIHVENDYIGGISYDHYGEPLADSVLEKARKADAVLLGAVGGPQWDQVPYDKRPEAGLLKIRKELGLFANLRPALVFDALIDASSLKPELIRGLDIMIVRELTGGIYFGEPRFIEDLPNGEKRGVDTQVYTSSEIQRIGHVGFDLARKRQGRLCSVDKANVMASGRLWRAEMDALHAQHYSDVALSHMFVDNCAMQLVRTPKQFDVIVTDNLFGDILSDEASMMTGSLGMLPSASLGAPDATGKRPALYEPVHGSAPDIAGTGKANPLAAILSFAMCLRYSFDLPNVADLIENSIQVILSQNLRTADIADASSQILSTSQMGIKVIEQMAAINCKAA